MTSEKVKKTKKFTFKNQAKLPGLMSVGHTSLNVDIKLNGKTIGWIQAPWGRVQECRVLFCVKTQPTAESNCIFKNICLKKKTSSVEEMKEWLIENNESLVNHYDFHIPS